MRNRGISFLLLFLAVTCVSSSIGRAGPADAIYVSGVYYVELPARPHAGEQKTSVGKGRLGRLLVTPKAIEFSFKVSKDSEIYAFGLLITKAPGMTVEISKDGKTIIIRDSITTWQFFCAEGVSEADKARVTALFEPKP